TSLQDTVQGTVGAVKDAFDLSLQVRRHPWAMLTGSVVTGYIAGRLLDRLSAEAPCPPEEPGLAHGTTLENGVDGQRGPFRQGRPRTAPLSEKFADELEKLKGLALGVLIGAARDTIVQSAPRQVSTQLGEVIDSFTAKLGGHVIKSPLIAQ